MVTGSRMRDFLRDREPVYYPVFSAHLRHPMIFYGAHPIIIFQEPIKLRYFYQPTRIAHKYVFHLHLQPGAETAGLET